MRRMPILLVVAVLLAAGCDSEEESLPYAWFHAGNEFDYEYEPLNPDPRSDCDPDSAGYYTTMYLSDESDECVRVEWAFPPGDCMSGALEPPFWSHTLCRKADGLFGSAATDCLGWGFVRFEFIRAPARPGLGQEFTEYTCSRGHVHDFEVVALKQTVTAKAGTFKDVFVIEDARTIEYWSESSGLIAVDFFRDGLMLGTMSLSAVRRTR